MMHPIYQLKDTHLEEQHKNWIGRQVKDRYGRHLGHVREILIEERSLDDAAAEDQDPGAWTARADLVVVGVERGLLGRIHAHHNVMVPLNGISQKGAVLMADVDADEIRTALY